MSFLVLTSCVLNMELYIENVKSYKNLGLYYLKFSEQNTELEYHVLNSKIILHTLEWTPPCLRT